MTDSYLLGAKHVIEKIAASRFAVHTQNLDNRGPDEMAVVNRGRFSRPRVSPGQESSPSSSRVFRLVHPVEDFKDITDKTYYDKGVHRGHNLRQYKKSGRYSLYISHPKLDEAGRHGGLSYGFKAKDVPSVEDMLAAAHRLGRYPNPDDIKAGLRDVKKHIRGRRRNKAIALGSVLLATGTGAGAIVRHVRKSGNAS